MFNKILNAAVVISKGMLISSSNSTAALQALLLTSKYNLITKNYKKLADKIQMLQYRWVITDTVSGQWKLTRRRFGYRYGIPLARKGNFL